MSDRWIDLLYYAIIVFGISAAVVFVLATVIVVLIFRDVRREQASGALRNTAVRIRRRH